MERATERAAERKRARDARDRDSDQTDSGSEDDRPKKRDLFVGIILHHRLLTSVTTQGGSMITILSTTGPVQTIIVHEVLVLTVHHMPL